tara:strand:+ start:5153 stop:5371 length:219 start_codon:yes stop_codon:yes gene_type:complete
MLEAALAAKADAALVTSSIGGELKEMMPYVVVRYPKIFDTIPIGPAPRRIRSMRQVRQLDCAHAAVTFEYRF